MVLAIFEKFGGGAKTSQGGVCNFFRIPKNYAYRGMPKRQSYDRSPPWGSCSEPGRVLAPNNLKGLKIKKD